MRAVVQRVDRASVSVDGETIGQIGFGLLVLVGVTHTDNEDSARRLADKIAKLRIFADTEDKMNWSILDVAARVLVISQFTLYGDAKKGNRPSFIEAARPEVAEPLIEVVVQELQSRSLTVETGRFGADMDVELVNQGPVTLLLEV